MKISLAYSTCPNDTFIFEAIANKRIDTEGLDFEIFMSDVEVLNSAAMNKKFQVSKLSYHAYAYLQNEYQILDSGSALGRGNGPLFISTKKLSDSEIANSVIAIPGKYTTANFLFSVAHPEAKTKIPMLFSDIEAAIKSGKVVAGVIIHENRFTYAERGFVKLLDLGEFWEQHINQPIPLGGIVVDRSLPIELKQTINRVVRRSLEYARQNPTVPMPYIKSFAQEIDADVMKKHIALFVNDFTLDLGNEGKTAIIKMLEQAKIAGLIDDVRTDLFL